MIQYRFGHVLVGNVHRMNRKNLQVIIVEQHCMINGALEPLQHLDIFIYKCNYKKTLYKSST